jgi:predicted phage-related endonuclease
MAQAESTPNPVRDFFTAAETAHSTNEIAGPTRQLRQKRRSVDRRYFIGGSDARIIMGTDEGALLRLWREKRGEIEEEDLSGNLIVQLGLATEELNSAH